MRASSVRSIRSAVHTTANTTRARPVSIRPILSTTRQQLPRFYGSVHSMSDKVHFPDAVGKSGEHFEPRQTMTSDDATPDPSKSLPLSPARQALVDDICELYSCRPTIKRVERYTPDCVYDDQFVYANDRYKMAGQWFALPKGFTDSTCHGIEVFRNDRDLIQFKNDQSWTFKGLPKTARINAIVSLSLDPETIDSDFIRVKYHKDQANAKDYSHEGPGFSFKKWQADNVSKYMDAPEVQHFKDDANATKEHVRKYGSGEGSAPKQDL